MSPLAWLGAIAIGLSLGLLGSGGSILTVPVLTYVVGQDEKLAIAGSLAIVGGISVIGALPYALRRSIDLRSVVLFGLPGMVGSYGGAWLSQFVSGAVQLVVFALLVLGAGVLLLRSGRSSEPERPRRSGLAIGVDGLVVGVITGFVGIGGGFLIVPALALLGGLPMHLAIGTSLVIIALKSFSGLVKHLDVLADVGLSLDWRLISLFVACGAAGSLVGNYVAVRLPREILRRTFAWFLFAMGAFVALRSVPELL